MDRVNLKVKPETAARLRAMMPQLSSDAGHMLTIDQALNHLLDNYDPDSWMPTEQAGEQPQGRQEVNGGPA